MGNSIILIGLVVVLLSRAEQAKASPILYLRFEQGSGSNLVDSVTNTTVGTTDASYSTNVPVNPIPLTGQANNYSLQFNGTSGATITGLPFLFNQGFGDGTLEFWINAPNQPNTRSIFWTRGDTTDTNRFNLYLSPGGLLGFDYRSPTGALHTLLPGDGTFTVPLDTWTFIAVTRTGDTYSFFENGILVNAQADTNPDLPTGTTWTLAGRPITGQSSPPNFVGLIDEVRFSDRALSAGEFLNAPQPVPEPSTLALSVIGVVASFGWSLRRRKTPLKSD